MLHIEPHEWGPIGDEEGAPLPTNAAKVADLCVVCLWTTLGLTLTALFLTLGIEAEVVKLLAVAR